MKKLWLAPLLALLCGVAAWGADEPPKLDKDEVGKTYQVPYRTTAVKHIMIRAKLNGKGPYNFILDTGAPAMFITEKVAEQAGVRRDKNHWGTCDRVEIEGGVVLPKVKMRVEDIFQLKGMNGLGLAGAELHGIVGYDVLARFRMEIDFTKDKLAWTELKWEPKAPKGMGNKGAGADPTLEIMGSLMQGLGGLLGAKANPDVTPRGFLGVELTEQDDKLAVKSVLAKSPADVAGLKAGDRLTKFNGRTVESIEDVERFAKKLGAGETVKLTVIRGGETKVITLKTGEGL